MSDWVVVDGDGNEDLRVRIAALEALPSGRYLSVSDVLERVGISPAQRIAINALKAEMDGKHDVALKGWKGMLEHTEHRLKAIDPEERVSRSRAGLTLDEIAKMRQMVLSGEIIDVE